MSGSIFHDMIAVILTISHVLPGLKYTKFVGGRKTDPDPGGELTALPRPLASFTGWKGRKETE